MRYSGLRISDVATLAADSLKGNRLMLYQAKTGEPISSLLQQHVSNTLNLVKRSSPHYFFWTGQSKLETTTGFCRARIAEILMLAKMSSHPHRFRARLR